MSKMISFDEALLYHIEILPPNRIHIYSSEMDEVYLKSELGNIGFESDCIIISDTSHCHEFVPTEDGIHWKFFGSW